MNVIETRDYLSLAWGTRKSVMIRGNHGIGKSAIVKEFQNHMQAVTKQEWGIVDIRLSQQDVGDLRGIPFRINGATFFAPPLWLPIHPEYQKTLSQWMSLAGETYKPFNTHARGILFLDEFNRATREVLQCAFELVLDRSLGGVPIPDGWLVVAAINDDQDIYEVSRLDAALLNRFSLIDFTPSSDDWFAWAKPRVEQGIMHSAVYQYLRRMEHKLDPQKEDIIRAAEEGIPLYTRRSWTSLAEVMAEAARQGNDLTNLQTPGRERWVTEVFTSYLGNTQAIAFLSFIKTDFKILKPSDIIDYWSQSVESQLQKLCASQRPMDLLGLNHVVVEDLVKRPVELTRKQQENILAYILLIPNEVAMDFFTVWCKKNKPQVDHIYEMQALNEKNEPILDPVTKRPLQPFKKRIFEVASKRKATV